MFFVYVYIHPITLIPFYVGKGTRDRDRYHWRNRNIHTNDSLRSILQEIDRCSQQPIIHKLIITADETEAFAVEKQKIQEYGRLDQQTGTLCNRTPGGEGFGNTGTKWSVSTRAKHMHNRQSNPRGVGFCQYNMAGVLLRTYANSAELAAAGFTNSQRMSIRACCRGDRYSVGGFRWSYNNAPISTIATTTKKRIHQLTKLGVWVATHESVAEASSVTNINAGDIASVARGNTRMRSAGGFVWKYAT